MSSFETNRQAPDSTSPIGDLPVEPPRSLRGFKEWVTSGWSIVVIAVALLTAGASFSNCSFSYAKKGELMEAVGAQTKHESRIQALEIEYRNLRDITADGFAKIDRKIEKIADHLGVITTP